MQALRDLLIDEMKDVYDAEHQITDALPKMAKATKTKALQDAFKSHLKETEGQIERLEKAFKVLGETPKRVTCDGMKGLIKEGEKTLKEDADPIVKDAAIIAAAQRVEHYEMAAYGSIRTYAELLGEDKVAKLFQETLDEEGAADEKLTDIAMDCVNPEAAKQKA